VDPQRLHRSAPRRRDRPFGLRRGPPLRRDRRARGRRDRRLVRGSGRRADPAAVVQQARPGAGHGRAGPRPPAGPARAGVRVALGGAVPRRRRTPDPARSRPGRVPPADPGGPPARRVGPRRGAAVGRGEGARADELLGQARGHAGDLRPAGLGHEHLPASRAPPPAGDHGDVRPADGGGRGCGRGRRLRSPAPRDVADRPGPRVRRSRPRHRRARAPRRRGDPCPPRDGQRVEPRRATAAGRRTRADREGRRRVGLRRGAPGRSRVGAQDRRRGAAGAARADGGGAPALGRLRRAGCRRRCHGRHGAGRALGWRPAGRRDPRRVL
ncbi:MAG: Hypothetical protein of L-Asparaginase type 2-like superfamily, partial [uncultured Nocardioides sp.]